jgi:hypothetical protein
MRGFKRMWGWSAVVGVVLLMLLGGLASASGSGYNLSFSQTPSNADSSVGLSSLSSSYSSGLYMNASFTVAGKLDLTSDFYEYWVYFGGIYSTNETAVVSFTNNTTFAFWEASSGTGGGFGYLPFTVVNSGSTIDFEINISSVGSSTSFALDAYALYDGPSGASYSWLGSGFGGGGSGSCTATSCNVAAPAGALLGGLFLFALIGVVIVVVVIVVVVVLVMRKRPPAAAPPPNAPPGWMPPPLAPGVPPPPPGAPMPPPPPPP